VTSVEIKSNSKELYARACELIPGGVNSPVRAFKAVGGHPLFFKRGVGSHLVDEDGNDYVDFVSSWGAIIHGHADAEINRAIGKAAESGTSFGAPHVGEIRLAEEILARVPSLERIRFVNSGTEATVAAIRLARAATGRHKILKFDGNYHGAADCLLAHAGSGVATFSLPDSSGVPPSSTADTLVARFNDLENVRDLLDKNLNHVAAIIVEPTSGNMGLVPPRPGFLAGLQRLCLEYGSLLIFDEVMTGFRVAAGGAAQRFSIYPDLFCFGKVIGGGLPVGAYGGRKELMDWVAPLGPMYQAGTLSGNPLAMAAGFSAVSRLSDESYARLEALGSRLEKGLAQIGPACDVALQVQRVSSMISVFLTDEPVSNFDQATKTNRDLFGKIFHQMLLKGFYLPPSALESWFLNLSHTEAEIDRTIEAFGESVREALSAR
jgi:glutamate-1-semialdehyde 2,1-aminomutase